MEVRVERIRNRIPFKGRKKLHRAWRVLLLLFLFCMLSGGIVLWKSQKPVLAAEYNMSKNPLTGKYVFRVVEVVPEKQSAVLGLFIEGKENQTIDFDKLESILSEDYYQYDGWVPNFIYTENIPDPSGNRPFSLIKENGKISLVNNEIFKLYMMGIGDYDPSKSYYDNLKSPYNQEQLEKFDAEYEIDYRIETPEELNNENINEIHYIHFGGTRQITHYPQFYDAVGKLGKASEVNKGYDRDISWDKALAIYERAVPEKKAVNPLKMSFSMSSRQMEVSAQFDWNLFKLYEMIAFFDDPALFRELFKVSDDDGDRYGSMTTDLAYIDRKDGIIYYKNYAEAPSWTPNKSWNDAQITYFNFKEQPHLSGMSVVRKTEDYLPAGYDNILLFYKTEEGYFDTRGKVGEINKILHFDNNGKPADDFAVKVLEIEPSNDYKFDDSTAVGVTEKKKLAEWLGTAPEEIEVTFVTPNELNALNTDLVSEYDMIYIGDRTGQLGSGTLYRTSLEAGSGTGKKTYNGLPYQHIGSIQDSVLTHTLINGLLGKPDDPNNSDKTNAADFAALCGSAFASPPGDGFLRNVSLELALGQSKEKFGHGRFSGNDITKSMKNQLKGFIESNQPVVVADSVYFYGQSVAEELKKTSSQQDRTLDANMYVLLAETRFQGGTEEHENVLKEGDCKAGTLKGALQTDSKPGLIIEVPEKNEEDAPCILEFGTKDALSSLAISKELSFTYQVRRNRANEDYIMKVLIDKNGDGIFDETVLEPKNQSGTDNQELAASFTIERGLENGTFSVPLHGGQSVCQFRVIVQETGAGGLRKSWTGYVRPEGTAEINILHIMSGTAKDGTAKRLSVPGSSDTAFESLLAEAQSKAPEYHIDLENGYTAVTASEFEEQFQAKDSLENYNLIIVGFDYGTYTTDITGDALKTLQDYITVQKKPIIFTKDTISYINTEYYKTPVIKDYQWAKVTEAEKKRLAGEGELVEQKGVLERREISEGDWRIYKEANEEIDDANQQVYLQEIDEEITQYEAVYGPVKKDKLAALPTEGKRKAYIGYWSGLRQRPMRQFKDTEEKQRYLAPNEIWSILLEDYRADYTGRFLLWDYELTIGWVTGRDLMELKDNKKISDSVQTYYQSILGFLLGYKCSFKIADILKHKDFWQTSSIKVEDVDENRTFEMDGETYYLHHGNYLAKESNKTGTKKHYYYWEKLVPSAPQLISVAGDSSALYPDKINWGYEMSQGLRSILSMDRFNVTVTESDSDKRDPGTVWDRKYASDELQGFTNGTLLEYTFAKDENGNPVSQIAPYSNELLTLGKANSPRTDSIRVLNEGVVGRYPFEIQSQDQEKIGIEENHAPYYQLDLERRTGEGKKGEEKKGEEKKGRQEEGDVTVWFTFTGSESNDPMKKANSVYFEVTDGDAGNNYYLYSKDNIYYSGYNLPDTNIALADLSENQETEMKLFINTIYAALSNKTVEAAGSFYDTVLMETGDLSQISLAGQRGKPNQYTCYYEEETSGLELNFRVQKLGTEAEPPIPLTIGYKGEMDLVTGLPTIAILGDTEYEIEGLADSYSISQFPVESIIGDPEKTGSQGSGVSDIWYTLKLKVNDDTGANTLIIGPQTVGALGTPDKGSIYAEVRMVKRDLFDLD